MIDAAVIREWGIIVAGVIMLLFFIKNLFIPLIFITINLISIHKKENKNVKKNCSCKN